MITTTHNRLRWLLTLVVLIAGVVCARIYAQNPTSLFLGATPTRADTSTGNATTATLRVVLATNQPTVPVSGTFFQATQPVSGTFWQATQPVSGTFWQATQPISGTVTANMGTVTADPFGTNADAASATGSISAKLRFIAGTGIPITGTVTVGSHAVTNAGTFATQSAITAASGSIGSGAVASGAIASGALASGAYASGSIGSGAIASGAIASGAFASGALGTGAIGSGAIASGAVATGAYASGAFASGAFASGSVSAGAYAVGAIPPSAGVVVSGAITSAMTGTTSTSLVSGTASNYLYITSCQFGNTHASVTTMELLQDGSGGTTLASVVNPFGSGNTVVFPTPLKVPTSGNALYVANVTTGSNTFASCQGFRSTTSW